MNNINNNRNHHSDDDIFWMQHALRLAQHAAQAGEVPIGAVVVLKQEIIGEGWNCPITTNDPSAHAEIMALRSAAGHLQNYRLNNTALYVTLEPCIMCVGAMIQARVERLVFGAYDPKVGAIQNNDWGNMGRFNHRILCSGGVLAEECSKLLVDFFQIRR